MSVSESQFEARRRRANADEGRKHRHVVRVTPVEEAKLLRLAEEQKVSVPRLLMESTLNTDRNMTVTEKRQILAELFAMKRLVGAISVNVNQLAAHANATGEVRSEAAATTAQARIAIAKIVDWIEDQTT